MTHVKKKQTAAVRMKLSFTDEERNLVMSAALEVWNEIGYDALCPEGENEYMRTHRGRTPTITRAAVIELVCDAGRLEEKLRRRDRALAERVSALGVDVYELVKPAFPHGRYGL